MHSILDRISQSASPFHPADARQYTAFQIARQFGDQAHLRDYLIAVERHPISAVSQAYRRTRQKHKPTETFFRQLKTTNQSKFL